MIEFLYHDGIKKEIAALERRFRNIIAPAKLHRISQNDIWAMWKIELVIPKSGLRPNQYPRMWFAVKGNIIAFLCIATHIDNYNEDELSRQALSRVTDIF